MAINEGDVARAVRRDSPWWRDPQWVETDRDLRDAAAQGIAYDPDPLGTLVDDGLYLLYGPRRVGKTVSLKRKIHQMLSTGLNPLQVVRVSVDGWAANRLGMFYEWVTRTATTSLPPDARRYWFIDEITATQGQWWSIIKDLRDNTGFRDDCVVLTGSSNSGLDDAIKALAGRRGHTTDANRALLPMTFTHFCYGLGLIPPIGAAVRPDELRSDVARAIWNALLPYTDDLVAAWQAYLDVGGYPQAVGDWKRSNSIDSSTVSALFDVVRGDLGTAGLPEPQARALLTTLAKRVTSTVSMIGLAEELGIGRKTLDPLIALLVDTFIVWRCPAADKRGRPDESRQAKLYFYDPLIARLPEIRFGQPPIDITRLNEQQLGTALMAWCNHIMPGTARAGGWVTHYKNSRAEIDFAGVCPDTNARMTALDGKYVSGAWRQEALTIRNSDIKTGVLATRDILAIDASDDVWAVPAAFIAYSIGL